MPKEHLQKTQQLTVYLHNMTVQVLASFEKSFESSMRAQMFKLKGWKEEDHKSEPNPEILERRLYV
jgi:hypothetical protein